MGRLFSGGISALNSIASVWVCILMLIITADVLSRNIFGVPIQGVVEVVKLSVVAMTWMMVAYTLRSGGHLRSNLLLGMMPLWGKKFILISNALAGMALLGITGWHSWFETLRMYRVDAYEGAEPVRIMIWPIWALLTLGAIATSLQYLLDAYRIARTGPSDIDDAGASVE